MSKRAALGLAIVLVLLAAWGLPHLREARRLERARAWCEDAARSVEAFQQTSGGFPESLDADLELPRFPLSPEISPGFRHDGRRFELWFLVPDGDGTNTAHVFDSATESWHSTGYVGPGL